jgi:glycosyltransferase involved in cell wall biosynthesis
MQEHAMKKRQCDLSVVVPVYNEVEVFDLFYKALTEVVSQMGISYEVIFVDDGSNDDTFKKIRDISEHDSHVTGVKFSRNFGHQMALFAGLSESNGAYLLMMDGDLQHPPELIPELWKYAQSGVDIVYTVRIPEENIGWFKKYSAKVFYAMFSYLTDVKLEENTADFRIISRKVCDEIIQMDERDLFLRGIFAWVGFPQKRVEYKANKRVKGESKYSFKKMFNLSISGITSFSTVPIRLSLLLCLFSLFVAFLYSAYALYSKFILEQAVQGWTSLLILMSLFFSGIFIILGIIGEYIAKIHIETKKRPRYIIEKIVRKQEEQP